MRHGSLFNGIGGFQLAAEWMGWENVFSCEIDEWCNKITKQHFKDCIQHGDITKTDFTIYRGKIDIITGGFPCQPYSQSGERKGREDERHLWPAMFRAIREVYPGWIVGENVPGLLNWEGGLVLDEIKADLESEGFEVFPSLVLPACGVNANHRRDRLFVVAYSNHIRCKREIQFKRCIEKKNGKISNKSLQPIYDNGVDIFRDDREIRANDGVSNWVDRIKGLGNAIVPQVAFEIFKAIEQYELQKL